MIARTPCPAAICMWFLGTVATPPVPDYAVDALPWCLPTWEVVPDGYGAPLTDTQVIGAHVATHPASERSGRMPSRAEVEKTATGLLVPAGTSHPHHFEECTP